LGKNGVGKSLFAKDILFRNKSSIVIGSYSNIPEDINFRELRRLLIHKFGNNNVNNMCDVLNTTNIDDKIVLKKLSDGQRQKIKIMVFLLFDGDIVILDEVTNALDKKTANEICTFFNQYIFNNPQKTILNITHNLSDLNNMEGNYYLFEDCNIKKYNSKNEIIDVYVNGGK